MKNAVKVPGVFRGKLGSFGKNALHADRHSFPVVLIASLFLDFPIRGQARKSYPSLAS
jgi:hypothetical protein